MTIPLAGRMGHLKTHFFSDLKTRLAALEAAGADVIRLDEGSPDMPPAPHIIRALVESAAQPDRHGYQPHRGPIELRQAWAETYQQQYGVTLDPQLEIQPLLGSKEGIFHLALAFIEPGDIVLAPDPGYVTYQRGALVAGGQVYTLPLLKEHDYLPDLEAIPPDILPKAKLLWLNYPNNPTAASATHEFFMRAVDFARRHGLLLCHDAAYLQVSFDGRPQTSLMEVPGAREVAVEFNTLSKSHNMAGWRSAALVGNKRVVQAFYTLKTNADSSHFRPVFDASVAALHGDQSWIGERNQVYRQRRDVIVNGLVNLGLDVRVPEASMYVWAPVPDGWDCQEFAIAALENAHVSLAPGSVFGTNGRGFMRIALTSSIDRCQLAIERLKKWLK